MLGLLTPILAVLGFIVSLIITLWSLKASAGVAYGKSSWRGAFIQLIVLIVIAVVLGIFMSLIGIGIGFIQFFPF